MPARPKGARLWLRPAESDGRNATWIVRDGRLRISTGLGAGDYSEAEKRLAAYIAQKHVAPRRERDIDEIPVGDVIAIYARDVIPGQARPRQAARRAERLLEFFGAYTLGQITGELARAYESHRRGQGRSNKGTGGGARRDLQDLVAAINYHANEGLHRGDVRVVLPRRGKARQRWMSRAEAAKLLWTCWRMHEMQAGAETRKRPLRHLCRFLLVGLYTGSRPGAILTTAWDRGPGRSWMDVDGGRLHRLAEGAAETNKRQPIVKLAPRLAAHARRWRKMDGGAGHVVTFDGVPVSSVKTALARASRLAGIEPVTAYALRHTCASWLVAKGLPTRLVAEFIGTSEAMVLAHYGHLAPDYQDAAARAIGEK